jgi:hypothetical protein
MRATTIASQHVGLFIKLQLIEEANFQFMMYTLLLITTKANDSW